MSTNLTSLPFFDGGGLRSRLAGIDFLPSSWQSQGLHLFPYRTHLLAGLVERAGVVDHVIGGFDFFFFGKLRGHAAVRLPCGRVER